MTISEVDATFVPGEDITCSAAQNLGLSGGIDPTRCDAYTPLAQAFCGCVDGGTLVPVEETEAPSEVVVNPTNDDEPVVDDDEPVVDDDEPAEDPTDPEDPVVDDEPSSEDDSTPVDTDTNESTNDSAAVSFQKTMAISSCLVGLLVALVV